MSALVHRSPDHKKPPLVLKERLLALGVMTGSCWRLELNASVFVGRKKGASQTCWSEGGWGQRWLIITLICVVLHISSLFFSETVTWELSPIKCQWKLCVMFLGYSSEEMRIPFMLPFPVPQATYQKWLGLGRVWKCKEPGLGGGMGRKVVLKPKVRALGFNRKEKLSSILWRKHRIIEISEEKKTPS